MTVCATLKLGLHVVVEVSDQDLSHGDMITRYRECQVLSELRMPALVRPNGPGELSPGLRPEADTLGRGDDKAVRPESAGRDHAGLATSNKDTLLLIKSRHLPIPHV